MVEKCVTGGCCLFCIVGKCYCRVFFCIVGKCRILGLGCILYCKEVYYCRVLLYFAF